MTTVAQAIKWSYVLSWGYRGMATLLTLVLAALLGPADFGVMAMAMMFIALIELVLEQGLTAALIQRPRLRRSHLDSAFWLILGVSLVLALVTFLLSGPWATLYKLPELSSIVSVLGLLLPIRGVSLVQQALMLRRLNFKVLALVTNAAVLLGGLAGLWLAFRGFGAWALVAQKLVEGAATSVLLWLKTDWTPRFRFSLRRAADLLSFSAGVFLAKIGLFIVRWSDVLLMGFFFGPVAVGLYRLAARLVNTVVEVAMQPLQAVALPHFSRVHAGEESLHLVVTQNIRAGSIILLPSLALVAAVASPLMSVIGTQWTPAANVLRILCLGGIVYPMNLFAGPLLQAVGRPYLFSAITWLGGASNAAALTAVALWLRAEPFETQIIGAAWAFTAVSICIHAPINLFVLRHVGGAKYIDTLRAGAPSFLAALSILFVAWLTLAVLNALELPTIFVLCVTVSVAGGVGLAVLLAAERHARELVLDGLRRWRPRKPEPCGLP